MVNVVRRLVAVALAMGVAATAAYAQTTIYAENPAPGDAFPASPDNILRGDQIGSTNWYYNWTRNSRVGIRTNLPYNGNGSVYFDVGVVSGSSAPQAGIAFYKAAQTLSNASTNGYTYAANTSSVIGQFVKLEDVVYSWYRSSTSNTSNTGIALARYPVLEINIDLDGNPAGGASGYLRFVRPAGAVPVDQWVTDSIATGDVLRWFGASGLPTGAQSLSAWKTYFQNNYPNAVIVGFTFIAYGEAGKIFQGALDNVSWTIGGQTTSFNFEVFQPTGGGGGDPVIPEPTTMALFALGLGSVALVRRRMA